MLSRNLNSKRAIHVNIQIMRVFTKLREMMLSHKDLAQRIDKKYNESVILIKRRAQWGLDAERTFTMQEHVKAKVFFESLNKDTMNLVDDFYDENILFSDPITQLNNRQQVKNYYANLYKNVESISWSFSDEINHRMDCALVWRMTLVAKALNNGKPIVVDGVSVIKFGGKEGKVIYHRDYFDMGAFVYEGVPLLGGIIRFVKAKMAHH